MNTRHIIAMALGGIAALAVYAVWDWLALRRLRRGLKR